MNEKAKKFFEEIRGKTVAICGIGKNNRPVIEQFLQAGATVRACDKRTAEQLGPVAEELTQKGVELCLGDTYLDRLSDVDLILRTPGMKPYLPPFEAARKAGVTVTSEMELFFDLSPAPVYAVTGSDGKTTTTTIIAGLLAAAGKTVHLGGNIGRPLLPIIGEVQPDDVAVVELSSFQLTRMQKTPHVAVVTNVAPNHLDWHTDMQEYIDAKRNLVAFQGAGDRAVLNADNAVTADFAKTATAGQVLTFSRKAPQEGAWLNENGMLCVTVGGKTTEVLAASDILIPGVHNVENYLAAIAATWGEVPVEAIVQYAKTFGGVPHRSELVRVLHGVKWYNDSIGSSPSRTIAGLLAFDRKVILIAGGYDKHIPYDPLGEVAKDTVKSAILVGATAGAIETAIRAYSDLPIVQVTSLAEAVDEACRQATDGDIVFMSPASASFDMYKNFEERGDLFKSLVMALPDA